MDDEVEETRQVPVKGLGIVAGVAAVVAVLANLIIAWLVGLPEGATTNDPLLVDLEAPLDDGAAASRTTSRLSESVYREGILGRNIFDHTQIGVEPDPIGGPDNNVSNLPVVLRGTVVATPEIYSAAFIAENRTDSAYAYGIGQSVHGAQILEILDDRVKILRDGKEEWLLLHDEDETNASGSAAAPPPEEGIEQESETEFVVSRAMIDEQLSDIEGLAGMARALLHRGVDGEYDGYRLSAIRRGSLPDKLGIRNGDIVHTVNGMEISSLDSAMRALEALKREPKLAVDVTRRGQRTSLSYDVR